MDRKQSVTTRELAVFAMLAAVMYLSKVLMEWIPNVHLLGMLIISYTRVYRKKALIPIYVYVLLNGALAGFSMWWFPYLYIWTVLWGMTMLLPLQMRKRTEVAVYMAICGLHGFLFGMLYAPMQALIFGLSLDGMVAWILAGIPFDIMHGIGNLAAGVLIVPMITLLKRLERMN